VNADGNISPTVGESMTSPEHFWRRRVREWSTSLGNGNLTEIGMFSAATGGVMWCRALFRDSSGTPITVTKTSADILRVTYEVRLYPALGDATQSAITISGTNYAFTWRPIDRGNWNFNNFFDTLVGEATIGGALLSPDTALPARMGTAALGSGLNASSATAAFNTATLVQPRTHVWNPASGALTTNSIGLGGVGSRCPYAGTVTPAIAKTAVNQLTLNYEIPWSRVTV